MNYLDESELKQKIGQATFSELYDGKKFFSIAFIYNYWTVPLAGHKPDPLICED